LIKINPSPCRDPQGFRRFADERTSCDVPAGQGRAGSLRRVGL